MSTILVLRATTFSSLKTPQFQLCRKQCEVMQYKNLDSPLFYHIRQTEGRHLHRIPTKAMNAWTGSGTNF